MDKPKDIFNEVKILLENDGILCGFCPAVYWRQTHRLSFIPSAFIMAAFPYLVPRDEGANLCRYAVVPDYHAVVGNRLQWVSEQLTERFPGHTFQAFTDASPVAEVKAAAAGGLGVIGDNGLLITPEYGSYCFIGTLITDVVYNEKQEISSCIHCGKCRAACPTGALCESGLHQTVCLSALTQKKGALNEAERQAIQNSGLVWGCDICQEVCPMNAKARCTEIPEFTKSIKQRLVANDLQESLDGRAYGWRGVQVLRRNLDIINNNGERHGEKHGSN